MPFSHDAARAVVLVGVVAFASPALAHPHGRELRVGAAAAVAPGDMEYGMLIDAGSSHSEIYVYEWPTRVFSVLPPPETLPITQTAWSESSHPGISSHADDPAQVGPESLKPLLNHAKSVLKDQGVAEERFKDFPIFLTATAGMRVLEPTKRAGLMDAVRAYFRSSDCPFDFQEDAWARVISGEEEGAFGWITVNHAAKTLGPPPAGQPPPAVAGALDMGGASTQITFDPAVDILAGLYGFAYATMDYRLYTHSFLYRGAAQALNGYIASLPKTAGAAGAAAQVTSPCHPTGYTENVTNPADPSGAPLALSGSSDDAECAKQVAASLVDKSVCLNGNGAECSFNGVYQPQLPKAATFYAFSGYYYSWSWLELKSDAPLSALQSKASSVCAKSKEELQAMDSLKPAKQQAGASHLYLECFNARYFLTLLHQGYGFPLDPSDTDPKVMVVPDLNGIEMSYAYGAMLHAVNILSWSYAGGGGGEHDVAEVPWWYYLITLAFAVGGGLCGYLMASLKRGNSDAGSIQQPQPAYSSLEG